MRDEERIHVFFRRRRLVRSSRYGDLGAKVGEEGTSTRQEFVA